MSLFKPSKKWTFKPPLGTLINPSHRLAQGLVGAWLFNEAGGGYTGQVLDSSLGGGTSGSVGVPNALTLTTDGTTAPTWAESGNLFGPALYFNTAGQSYLEKSSAAAIPGLNLYPSNAFTLSAWVYLTSAPQGVGVICSNIYGTDGSVVQYELGFSMDQPPGPTSTLAVGFYTGGWQIAYNGGSAGATSAPLNQWIHIAGTWDGGTLRIYQNGILVGNNTIGPALPFLSSSQHFVIGRRHDSAGTTNYFPGIIDVPLVYNRALSATEIQQLYCEPFTMFQPQRIYVGNNSGVAPSSIGWFPRYPDAAAQPSPMPQEASTFNVVPTYGPNCGTWDTINAVYQCMVTPWNLIGMCTAEWLPDIPAIAPKNPPVQNTNQEGKLTISTAVTDNGWYPEYADQPRPNLRAQVDFTFTPVEPLNFKMPWLPRYPDQVPSFTQTIPAGQAFGPIEFLNFDIAQWLPRYPDQAPLSMQQIPGGQVFGPIEPLSFRLPWLPRYPDQVPFFSQLITGGQASEIFPAPPTVVNLLWLPRYPDQVPFFTQVIPAGQAFGPIESLNFKMPWLPVFSDQQRLNLRPQADFVFMPGQFLALPIALTWFPIYPDQQRLNLRPQADFVFSPRWAITQPTLMPWLPILDVQPRPNWRLQADFTFMPGQFKALPVSLSWLPRYLDQVPFFTQVIPAGQTFEVIPVFGFTCGTWSTITNLYQTIVTPWGLLTYCPMPPQPPVSPIWTPPYVPVSVGRQVAPALQALRQTPPELKETRRTPPVLKLLRKKPPTLT